MTASNRILVIDDDKLMRKSVAVLLRSCGYEDIITAENGREGLVKFHEIKPDVTLLDLRMPEMDGLEFLEEVQEMLSEIPVIILSGVGSVDDVIKSLQLGAWDYVVKPIGDFSILDHAIRKALERARLIKENRRYQDFLEQEVKKRTAELYQAQKMEAIGTLAGGIAHDFNNYLASIIGYCDMAMEQIPSDGQPYRDLENVLSAANSAAELVKQILTFSRQGEVEAHPVHVQDVLRQVIKLVRSTFPSSITINETIDEDCKPILADASQVQQVLMNLCANAKHAIDGSVGSISISLSQEQQPPGDLQLKLGDEHTGEYLKIVVSDTGHGMEEDVLVKIFEPFFTTKSIGQGTGLGLSVAHGIITKMGGDIHVESSPGKGSMFQIYLPVVNIFESEKEEQDEKIPGGTEKILLVDDDPRIVQILERGLSGLGYKITAFVESPKALEEFNSNPNAYDLVITDMTMPVLTGRDLALQMLAVRPDIPIVMCTGYSEVMDSVQAKEIGIRSFVMKPIIKKDLATILRKVLDHG